jgi:hypothetical protein
VLPVAGLVLAGAAWCLLSRRVPAGPPGRRRPALAAALALALFLPGWAYGLYRLHRHGPIPSTPAAREDYLARRLPLYPAVRHLNQTRRSRYVAFAFDGHRMVYFARGRWLGNYSGIAPFFRFLPLAERPDDLHRELTRLGVTHLVVAGDSGVALPAGDPRFRRLFHEVFADRGGRVYALVRNASLKTDII